MSVVNSEESEEIFDDEIQSSSEGSLGEEDDLIPGPGVNMPQMNLGGNTKFNQGNFNGKEPKFNSPNIDSKNMKMGNMGGNMTGPNTKGALNFEQNKESSQIFGIKTSGKKKNVNMPNMNMPDMPPSALLDDDYEKNYGIEMGRIGSDNQRFSGKGDMNFGGSLIGSAADEK